MPVERSAGIIIFQNTTGGRRYLVLRASRRAGRPEFWDVPKGILEKGETAIRAARREVREEAGISDFEFIPDFKTTARYFTRRTGRPVPKFVALFLAEVASGAVKLSWEHNAFAWLPYDAARARLTNPQIRKALDAAEEFLRAKAQSFAVSDSSIIE